MKAKTRPFGSKRLCVCERERSKFRLLREREEGPLRKGGEEKGLTNGGVLILKKFASVLVLDPIGFFFSLASVSFLSLFFCFFVFSNVRISGNLNSETGAYESAYVKYRICPLMGFFEFFFFGIE